MKSQLITLLLIGSLFSLTACQTPTTDTEESPTTEQEETTIEEPEEPGMSEEESTEDSADE
ncbi:MAG: hypothetical protein GVY04_22255 [Cyanobacteria bacterium]|jgi:hypothetical protein|nr:hypothetical protein [Cyanobacteria bacterium GSL.Bin1]